MNAEFGLVMSLLVLVSVAVLLLVLLRRHDVAPGSQGQRIGRNVRLYRQRLEQWRSELQEGLLSQDDFDTLYNEASRQLLADVEHLQQAPQQSQERRKWLLVLAPTPLLAVAVYWAIGAWPDWVITQDMNALADIRDEAEYREKVGVLHDRIEHRLARRPDHVEYRLLLARYDMGQQDYTGAAAHYGVLAEILPNDADIWGYYAQAEFLRAGRKVTPLVAVAIEKALQLDPFQKTVLGLQGIDAFERGDLRAAIASWEKLLVALGDDVQSAELIRQGIARARAQLGDDAKVADAPGVSVKVLLGDNLPPMDSQLSVFVYAKAAVGPPMPLAVKRLQLRDMPAEIRLDDSMAMMPEMKLSQFDEVVIGARISFSGQPVAQKGDWQGETAPFKWKESGKADVRIEQQVQ